MSVKTNNKILDQLDQDKRTKEILDKLEPKVHTVATRDSQVRFSMKLAAKICVMIEDKMTIAGVSEVNGMPSRRSIHRWRHKHPKFHDMMVVSETIRLNNFVDEMMDLTSVEGDIIEYLTGKYYREPTQRELNAEAIRRRLRVDTIKFLSAKLYADRSGSNNVTQVDKVINVVNYASIKTEKPKGVSIIPDLQPDYLKHAAMLTPAQQAQVDLVTKR